VTHKLHQTQKQNFDVMSPHVLFTRSIAGPPRHEE
jgi:hypothetical protein